MSVIVVGDSVGLGISQAIPRSYFSGAEGLRIDQMQNYFNSAIAQAQSGDTVIISAGYNSTGANGLAAADVTRLQGWVNELHNKGARVVIAALHTDGMQGSYARLNGAPAETTNRQLAGIQNASFANGCRTVAGRAADGLHGGYDEIARICQEAAVTESAPSTPNPNAASAEADRAQANRNEGGFMSFLRSIANIPILGGLVRGICSIFGVDLGPETPAAGTSGTSTSTTGGSPSNPGQAQSQAQGVSGNGIGGGTDTAEVELPRLPAGNGQRVRTVG